LLLKNGVPMKDIQEWLGHSDYNTTANIYAHLDTTSKSTSATRMTSVVSINPSICVNV
jgi:site-specific recombinase xerD